MKQRPWIGLFLLTTVCVAVVLSLQTGPLFAQDRRPAQAQPERQPVPGRTQQLPNRGGVNAEAAPVLRDVPATAVAEPTVRDVLHMVEVEGVNLPDDTRVLSPITARHEVGAVSVPNDPRLRLRVGKTQVHTVTLGGELPVLNSVIDWYDQIGEGQMHRRSMSIIQLALDGEKELQRTNLYEVLPVELSIDITTGTWRLVVAAEHVEFAAR